MDPGLKLGPIHYSPLLNWTYYTSRNFTKDVLEETSLETYQSSISPLEIITGTLIGLLLTSRGSVHKVTLVVKYLYILKWSVGGILLLLITVPLFAVLFLYRCMVYCILKMKSSNFISLMEGQDTIWNMKDVSEPIITSLIEIESNNGAHCLLKDIKEAILKTILSNPRLSWNRNSSCLGFSYWETCTDVVALSDRVRWIPTSKKHKYYITPPELQKLISEISSERLSNSNSCWEVLVGQQYIRSERKDSRTKIYPILLRIHHSLGDGVSLLNILLRSLSSFPQRNVQNNPSDCYEESQFEDDTFRKDDKSDYDKNNREKYNTNYNNLKKYKRGIVELFVSKGNINFLGEKMNFHDAQRFQFSSEQISRTFSFILKQAKFFVNKLHLLLNSFSMIRKTCEGSILDANKLSGKKIVAWYNDSSQGSLFSAVKFIKSHNRGIRFTDVVLTFFSSSIEKYLKRRNASIPNNVTVVVPVYPSLINDQMKHIKVDEHENYALISVVNRNQPENIQLHNSISLGIVNLPINIQGKVNRLHQVSRNMDVMRLSGQFVFSSFLLKYVAKLFPHQLLNLIFNCAIHNTATMSNLIGPGQEILFAGYLMKNVCFWVPHWRDAGISMSILSYSNRLHVGLMVDTSIINSQEDVQCILNDIISDVMLQVDKIIQIE